ncbi:MAG: hypothetical protein HIU92_16395 [Proteobacteria bacterium]|nr:hypothetical protein [Pseudomonadota bacterium]
MPMELYSSEAFVRDIVNAISESEGKPLNIGSTHHQGIDRAYAYQLIADAKRAVDGLPVTQRRRAARAARAALPKDLPKEARVAIAAAKKARR